MRIYLKQDQRQHGCRLKNGGGKIIFFVPVDVTDNDASAVTRVSARFVHWCCS